ncbi:hypothetical protein [Lentzea flaviverrucosa]|nr:hypothetical protein [Lentzea flaviverrucosa]
MIYSRDSTGLLNAGLEVMTVTTAFDGHGNIGSQSAITVCSS